MRGIFLSSLEHLGFLEGLCSMQLISLVTWRHTLAAVRLKKGYNKIKTYFQKYFKASKYQQKSIKKY
jgi:hypothetical protein